jgi:hypothetical protein
MKMLPRLGLFLAISSLLTATIVPRMAFEQIVSESTKIVHGRVLDSRAEDVDGMIWTHYRVLVLDSVKGANGEILTVSEPGGVLGGVGMMVQGSIAFEPGEEDVLFLYETPIGFWRTTGWSQGKFDVVDSAAGKYVRAAQSSVDLLPNARAAAGQNIDSFNGQPLANFLDAIRRQAGVK